MNKYFNVTNIAKGILVVAAIAIVAVVVTSK